MAKGVWATPFRLNAQSFEPALHSAIHSASRYSTVWLRERDEDISTRAAGPRLQIAQDRLSDFVLKRIALISAAFRTLDAERLFPPVNVDQPQARNLAAAQRIDGTQQQHSVRAQGESRRHLVLTPEKTADIAPRGTPRNTVVFGQNGFADSPPHTRRRPPPPSPLHTKAP